MASNFMVSAPGKVILFGEHAAVYNKPAIAAAISLRSRLLVAASANHGSFITLDFRDIGLSHVWSIDALPWHLVQSPDGKQSSPAASLDTSLLEAIRPHAAAVGESLSLEQNEIRVRSATAFLYLLLSLGSRQSAGSVYTLRSQVPIGAGLGSSASVCVCWSAALLLQTGRIAQAGESKYDVELISRWAFVGEQCIHGNPSGVDNTVSSRGQAVLYQKIPPGTAKITFIPSLPKLHIYLINTHQTRTTAVQVEKVRKNLGPETRSLLDKIGQLTNSALELISSSDFGEHSTIQTVEGLGALIRENHKLLISLGVSHPRLDRIVEVVDANLGWAKLTGAGGGGCAIILPRPGVSEKIKGNLERQLQEEGYGLYKTFLGAKGVGFLDCSKADKDSVVDIMTNGTAAELENEAAAQLSGLQGLKGWTFW